MFQRLAVILVLAFATLGGGGDAMAARHAPKPAPKAAAKAPAVPAAPINIDTPQLLVDMTTGDVLHEDNAGAPWHPASLTKLMTAYVAFQAIADKRVSLDTKVTMSVKAVSQAPGNSGLPAGDTVSMQDALYIMLVKSANDMAVAIAETVGGNTDTFVAEMNATAEKLGLSRTHYNNPNGLPDDGQVTTARDLAVLAIDLRRTFPQYDPIFRTQMVMLGKVGLRTNNELLTRFAGTNGMKTGYVCGSGLNVVATVDRGGKQLMAVVLGGSSARERDEMAAGLLLRGFSGDFHDSGKSVVDIVDDPRAAVMDMKPYLCGAKAKAYVSQRLAQFPMGLRGKPSNLSDRQAGQTYAATDLGHIGAAPITAGPDAALPAEGDGADDADPVTAPSTPAAPNVVAPVPQAPPHRR